MSVQGYEVTFEQGSTGWSAYLVDLPGCFATAATREECERLIREGVPVHLEGPWRQGERLARTAGGAPRE